MFFPFAGSHPQGVRRNAPKRWVVTSSFTQLCPQICNQPIKMNRVLGMRWNPPSHRKSYAQLRPLRAPSCYSLTDPDGGGGFEEGRPPFEWYRGAYAKLLKMAHALRHFDQVDGRVLHVDSNNKEETTIRDENIIRDLHSFKTIAKAFILRNARQSSLQPTYFNNAYELQTTVFDTLTKVCNFLSVTVKQRKTVRWELCREITHHHVWREMLEEVLGNLQREMDVSGCNDPKAIQMGQQIISCCTKFLKETGNSLNEDATPLWAQLWSSSSPKKKMNDDKTESTELLRWAEVAAMFQDLTECLQKEERLAAHLAKVEDMKEGLYQMKNIVVERGIGYNNARNVDSLIQKRLSLSLGHSSRCLFTLLLFYLYGNVRDLEVDACGLHRNVVEGQGAVVCVGKVLTSVDEWAVRKGVKQLDRALGIFKFVWEMAKVKGALELQGHLWSVEEAKERSFKYRGNDFFLHQLTLETDDGS